MKLIKGTVYKIVRNTDTPSVYKSAYQDALTYYYRLGVHEEYPLPAFGFSTKVDCMEEFNLRFHYNMKYITDRMLEGEGTYYPPEICNASCSLVSSNYELFWAYFFDLFEKYRTPGRFKIELERQLRLKRVRLAYPSPGTVFIKEATWKYLIF